MREGDQAYSYYPFKDKVQESGSCVCPTTKWVGTLGVRVNTSSNTRFYYITAYHPFENGKNDFGWLYKVDEGSPVLGQLGDVILHKYELGPKNPTTGKQDPLLDCALIQLSSTSQTSIAPDLYQGECVPQVTVRDPKYADCGMLVKKYGMATGLTYGRVIELPSDIDEGDYGGHLFAVELCDKNGNRMCGTFCAKADSGAPIIDMSGYVLGLIIQGQPIEGGDAWGIANRIHQIQAALNVTIH